MGRIFGTPVKKLSRKSQLIDQFLQKSKAFLQGVKEGDLQIGTIDEERQAGKAGAGPQIEDGRPGRKAVFLIAGQAVGHVLNGDFFRLGNGRQVHDLVGFDQGFLKDVELAELVLCNRKPHSRQGRL